MRVGIVGAGTIGLRRGESLRKLGADIVGVVTRQPERRVRAEQELGAPSFDNAETLLREARPEALVVASPNALHAEHVLLGLRGGCHVLCEKPLTTSAADAALLLRTAETERRHLAVAYNLRFTPSLAAAMQVAKSGVTGHILHAEARWTRRRGIPGLGRWNTTSALSGGGALLDAGAHVLDCALLLMGRPKPVSVSAMTVGLFSGRAKSYRYKAMWNGPPDPSGPMDVEDSCVALIRFAEGSFLVLDVAWARNGPERACSVDLYGEDAGLLWSKGAPPLVVDDRGETAQPLGAADDLALERAFLAGAAGNPGPDESAIDALALQVLFDAIYASARERREVSLL